ncbi:arrestin domain-containing protein 4-like [Topomyia yanbarensis]|uniref:arrestin domain-containing protein 4-like n=1 Tax=Topomyia yanbarensis TaxID=2498891 RepID=UPI00273BCAD3|nr:arrestin domain-containing protein 4-like [Topomyia yanbarensis]
MTVTCEIKFENNPQSIFYVGQTLNGTAVLQLSEAESVTGVYVQIEGFTAVHWKKRPPQGQRHGSKQFSGREDYLNTLTYVVGGENGAPLEIAQGTHVFKFVCALPDTLPTSFEGQYGHVRYTITICVERPTQQNTIYREAITVLRQLNLNDDPTLRGMKKLELSKQFGWWVFKSDPLDITVEVQSTGFVPGQSIPVLVQWNNGSKVIIQGIRIKLYKNEIYFATDPFEKSRTDTQSIAKIENRDAHTQGLVKFERNLPIPATPPSAVSPLITISYDLVVYIHISTGEIPEFKIPITIGTIPLTGLPPIRAPSEDTSVDRPSHPPTYGFNVERLQSDFPGNKAGAPTTSQTVEPTTASPPGGTETPLIDLPPPSYEEAMHANTTNLQEDEDSTLTGFKPRYPVYNFDGSGPSQQ